MSEQGPGGYGGGYGGGAPPGGGGPPGGQPPGGGQGGWGPPPGAPPGGYGPPPGAPPGGYGQPPGGYGQPPGGYGQPPGAPPGWPPQPGYGPPGVAPTAPGTAPGTSKTNPLVWLGIGCGALLLLGGAAAAGIYFYMVRPAAELEKAVSAAGGLGASVSVTDAGVVVSVPGLGTVTAPATPPDTATPGAAVPNAAGNPVAAAPSGSALPTPTTITLTPGGPSCAAAIACCKAMLEKTGASAQAGQCDALKNAPEFGCAQALATYRKTAALVGAACP